MSKIIEFEGLGQTVPAQAPLYSEYTIHHTTDDGEIIAFRIDGEEDVVTTCPVCGKLHSMSLLEFCQCMADEDFGLYDTMIFCDKCTATKREERERAPKA